MRRKVLRFFLIWEPLIELAWIILKWTDNNRKGKTVSEFWSYMWVIFLYGEVNGRVPLADIEKGWRKGTWFEQTKGSRGWQGSVYIDTPEGTLYKGKLIEEAP